MVQSVLALPEHLDLFENGIAARARLLASPGPQGARLARAGVGRPHRDRRDPHLPRAVRALLRRPDAARWRWSPRSAADARGNLYTGPNTEDTPAIVEATAFSGGIVIAQVNEMRRHTLPRVDIPADWVDFVVQAPRPNFIEPLFTRDPAQITEIQVLMAMMAIKGIYAEYGVQRLNHGIGFDTAAIELLLPTYARIARAQGQDLQALGAQSAPDADPGDRGRLGRVGPLLRLRARHGGLHAARAPTCSSPAATAACAATARSARRPGHYACDLFIGSTLQIDLARQQLDRDARAASPASAARPTWAPTRAAGATPARPG